MTITVYEYMTAPSGTVHVRRQEAPWMGRICGVQPRRGEWPIGDETTSAIAATCGRCRRIAGVNTPKTGGAS